MTENAFSSKYVFMSYSRKDEPDMQRIAEFLRVQGIKVWVDNEKLVPGTPIWEEEIEKAIRGASAVVVILSPDSKESVWVRREISLAEQNQKRIFPIMVAGDEETSITLRLITSQFVDIRENESAGLNALNVALSFYLEDTKAETEPPVNTKENSAPPPRFVEKENTPFLLSQKGRALIGLLVGVFISSINYSIDSSYFDITSSIVLIFACVVAGLLAYPRKLSLLFLFLGFFVAGIALSYDEREVFIYFTGWGALLGFPGGALLSRMILSAKKTS